VGVLVFDTVFHMGRRKRIARPMRMNAIHAGRALFRIFQLLAAALHPVMRHSLAEDGMVGGRSARGTRD
jgi:hypothetical protein